VVKKEFDRLLTHHFVDPAKTVSGMSKVLT
jgi:hypothetical protein